MLSIPGVGIAFEDDSSPTLESRVPLTIRTHPTKRMETTP